MPARLRRVLYRTQPKPEGPIRQEFLDELDIAGNDRDKLLRLMASLDEEKRSIKAYLRRLSSEVPSEHTPRGRERQVIIRRALDKQAFLKAERELVRARLGQLKVGEKTVNRAANTRSPQFRDAFWAAACEVLEESALLEVEARAAQLLQVHQATAPA